MQLEILACILASAVTLAMGCFLWEEMLLVLLFVGWLQSYLLCECHYIC